ncbi:MAG: hypothetical protein BWY21_02323 [Parcubacteria group bacterium ADurb.Bin216]|nr:MAG: hypothetical protein BWY21_02323 [Parcubacteria group bacterium ADurb.Bin216]
MAPSDIFDKRYIPITIIIASLPDREAKHHFHSLIKLFLLNWLKESLIRLSIDFKACPSTLRITTVTILLKTSKTFSDILFSALFSIPYPGINCLSNLVKIKNVKRVMTNNTPPANASKKNNTAKAVIRTIAVSINSYVLPEKLNKAPVPFSILSITSPE